MMLSGRQASWPPLTTATHLLYWQHEKQSDDNSNSQEVPLGIVFVFLKKHQKMIPSKRDFLFFRSVPY
jgi:hypothetical protein